VRPACLRRWRTRRPSDITSSPGAAVDGWETSLFQLEGGISAEYAKNGSSFQPFSLERELEVLKSGSYGKNTAPESGRQLNDEVPTYQFRSSIKEINDDCSI
jgi:hypothetical protein